MTTDEKDFLARWSRRKQAAREGLSQPEPDAPDLPAGPADAPSAEPEPVDAADEQAFADVDFDALDYSSDYTRFMGKDVPEMIQRRALRALWRSDPVLANIDGLNDYDEDFTDAATVIENLVSAYKTGQGYRTDEEMAALEAEEKAEAEARAAARSGDTGGGEAGAQAVDGSGEVSDTAQADPVSGEAAEPAADAQTADSGQDGGPASRT